jgi:hypothetical protein
VLVVALLWAMRPWYRPVVVLLGTIGLGFAVHAIVAATWSRGTARHIDASGAPGFLPGVTGPITRGMSRFLDHWVLLPSHAGTIAGWSYFALICAALILTLIHGWWRTLALIPTLYLASFVWENKMVQEVSGATRLILLGALLVVIMNVRPSGIFGTSRVEIV